MAAAARKTGVPVVVDAAAELPQRPNPYLTRGADLVAYSGGKVIRGPQCAGLLLGRKDLGVGGIHEQRAPSRLRPADEGR